MGLRPRSRTDPEAGLPWRRRARDAWERLNAVLLLERVPKLLLRRPETFQHLVYTLSDWGTHTLPTGILSEERSFLEDPHMALP